ncbi:MAG: hypothetical protein B7733_09020, partial [Myxococcales bacterium FL481]
MVDKTWSRLHATLRALARDQFAAIDDVGRLAEAAEQAGSICAGSTTVSSDFAAFAEEIAAWSRHGQLERRRIVAWGLRLCLTQFAPATDAAPARPRKRASRRAPSSAREVTEPKEAGAKQASAGEAGAKQAGAGQASKKQASPTQARAGEASAKQAGAGQASKKQA